jgi:hypothetical protein
VKCRHCGAKEATRPKGLCWGCYYDPAVKALYPTTSKYANKGIWAGVNKESVVPPAPTDSLPGSGEKVDVMGARVARGESAFHPQDKAVGP